MPLEKSAHMQQHKPIFSPRSIVIPQRKWEHGRIRERFYDLYGLDVFKCPKTVYMFGFLHPANLHRNCITSTENVSPIIPNFSSGKKSSGKAL